MGDRLLAATLVLAVWMVAGACAPEVTRRAAMLTPLGDGPQPTLEVLEESKVEFGTGYSRRIPQGSMWAQVGRTAEGDVYRRLGDVFVVEGAHVHEAYLVLAGSRLVGFYLPVERAFVPLPEGAQPTLTLQRR